MFARTTLLEVDTLRISVREAFNVFSQSVLPHLQQQPGFRGCYALTTDEGRAMLISFWDTADQADASGDTGWYPEALARHTTMFRSPPGRERYEVALAIVPEAADAWDPAPPAAFGTGR